MHTTVSLFFRLLDIIPFPIMNFFLHCRVNRFKGTKHRHILNSAMRFCGDIQCIKMNDTQISTSSFHTYGNQESKCIGRSCATLENVVR
jgi:hypothetical protein